MGFSRQEYWSGLPFPSPGDLPNPGVKSRSPILQVDSLPSEPPGKSHSLALGVEDMGTELCKWSLNPDAHQIFYVEWKHIVPTYGHYCNYTCWCDSYSTDCFKWIPEVLLAFFSLCIFSIRSYPASCWLKPFNSSSLHGIKSTFPPQHCPADLSS